ncbi:MAG: ParB N-terminal domain-containing protein, partial [Rhodomicrobium sp.]
MQESIASTAQRSAHRTRLSICYLPLAQLKPDPRNARVHSKKQIRQIARSIESFGFNMPILIDGENNIVAGHARVLAAKLLGLAEVPAVRLEHLTEAQRRAFAIADNRLTEIASWDDRLLGETLKELAILDLDFALEATGFETGEIDLRIEALSQNERDPVEPPIPAVSGPAVTRTGDLWLLDRHRVLCGDALDAEAYRTLLGSKTASATFTDPPYHVPIDGHVSGLGQTRHREFPMAAGKMDAAAFTKFLETSLRHMAAFSRSGAVHYVCMDWRHAAELLIASRAAGFDMLNLCVWTKPNAGMGSFYRSQHEFVFVFKAGLGRHQNNVR